MKEDYGNDFVTIIDDEGDAHEEYFDRCAAAQGDTQMKKRLFRSTRDKKLGGRFRLGYSYRH